MNTSNATVCEMPSIVREAAIADGYRLLAMLLQFPTDEVVSGLSDGSIALDIEAIAEEAGMEVSTRTALVERFTRMTSDPVSSKELFDDIRRERTRLFDHPDHPVIRLYEGVFLDEERKRAGRASTGARLFINPAALDAERCYRQAGIKRSSDINIPADCITTELEFLAHLHRARAEALADGDERRACEARGQLEEFGRIHMAKWFLRFFERCEQESRHALYNAVGTLGTALLDVDGRQR